MTHNKFIKRTIKILQDPEMTLVMGAAVTLGVVYACVAPWFYCKPNKPEEESRARPDQESDANVSSANQTLTSTNIRITGLRGLNFVSITLPNQPSVTGTTGHSSEAPSRLRSSIQHSNNDDKLVRHPVITHPDTTQPTTIPEIHISSASTDTTMYPLSSKTSSNLLTVVGPAKRHCSVSTDSNNPRCDAIRSHDVDNHDFGVRRMSQLKIRKPPRAHLPNSRKPQNTSKYNQDSLSCQKSSNGIEMMQKKSLDANEIPTANHFIERKNSNLFLKQSENVAKKSLSDQETRHSLYPDVNIIVRTNSLSTTFPSSSNVHQNSGDIIQTQDWAAGCPASSSKIIGLNSSLADNFPSGVENFDMVSAKSRNKSAFSNFFKKRCKKLWMNVNKNNCDNAIKSKCSIESVTKNNPTGHSTPIEKLNPSGEVQGHLNQFKCRSETRAERNRDCHNENLKAKRNYNVHERNYVSQGIPCFSTSNSYEATQLINTPSTFSNIYSRVETTNQRSPPFRRNFECIDDEPLDLSTKSRVNNTNIDIEKDSNNNCTSETSFMFTFKKRTNFIFTKSLNKKFCAKNKSRSLPERNEMNILKSISHFCYRSQRNEDETMQTHVSDSTHYPELKSMKARRGASSSGFLTN